MYIIKVGSDRFVQHVDKKKVFLTREQEEAFEFPHKKGAAAAAKKVAKKLGKVELVSIEG